jgi:hypothetical protein
MPRLPAAVICALLILSISVEAEPLWVAVGYGGRRISSTDGLHWENDQHWSDSPIADDNALLGIAYGKPDSAKNARFIAVGGGPKVGRILTTEDGKAWRELPKRQERVESIAFGQGSFVALQGAQVFHSNDGEQFIAGAKLEWPGIVHARKAVFGEGEGGGMFVIIGEIELPDEHERVSWRAATPDGESFSKTENHAPEARDLAFGAGHFVIVGPAGLIETSHDGLTWQRCESDPTEDFQSVTWTGKRFIARGNATWTSSDGLTWSRETWRIPCHILWSDELKAAPSIRALGLTWEGNLQASKDFTEWIKPAIPPGPPLTAIASSAE